LSGLVNQLVVTKMYVYISVTAKFSPDIPQAGNLVKYCLIINIVIESCFKRYYSLGRIPISYYSFLALCMSN